MTESFVLGGVGTPLACYGSSLTMNGAPPQPDSRGGHWSHVDSGGESSMPADDRRRHRIDDKSFREYIKEHA